MAEITARDYPHVYKSLGIDLNKLGCIMVDTEAIPVTEMVTKADLDLYISPNPEHFWINGAAGENGAHLTVLYGLLQEGPKLKAQVDEVLRGWVLDSIEIEKVGFFDSTISGEDYVCIVGHVKVTPAVLEGHQRLSLLPHVNTFGQYRPHVTLAYVKPEAKRKWLRELGNELTGKKLSTLPGLNYGGTPK